MTGLAKWIIFLCMALSLVASCGAVTTCVDGANYCGDPISTTFDTFSISQAVSPTPISPDTVIPGIIPCPAVDLCPAVPGAEEYVFSLAQQSLVTIVVNDCCIPGDQYNVYVDEVLIGTTSPVDVCGEGIPGSGTFTIPLSAGDHILRFEDTCICFTGVPPCYGTWLGAGFDFSYSVAPVTATPEFPSLFLPATFIIGLLGAVLLIQRTKEH